MSKILEYKFAFTNSSKQCKDFINSDISFTNKALILNSNVRLYGDNSYITIPHNISLVGQNKMQIEIIVQSKDNSTFVLNKNGFFHIYKTGNELYIEYSGNSSTHSRVFYNSKNSEKNIHYYLIQIDLFNSIFKVYCDNRELHILSETNTFNSTFANSTSNLYLGCKTGLPNTANTDSIVEYISIYDSIFTNDEKENRFTQINGYLKNKYTDFTLYEDEPTNNLKVKYDFNNSVQDLSVNGYNGTLQGAASVSSGLLVVGNNDLDYMIVPYNTLNTVSNFTIAAHCKINNINSLNTWVSCANNTTANEFVVLYEDSTTSWKIKFKNGTEAVFINSVINDMQLHHICFVKLDTSILFYLDGIYIEAKTINSGELNIVNNGIVLGQKQTAVNSGFLTSTSWSGEYDNFRIYNRILSSEEIILLKEYGGN